MLKIKDILIVDIVLLLVGCSGDEIAIGNGRDDNGSDPVGMPIQFSVGLEGRALTRTDEVPLANDVHFTCSMYYHSKTSDTNENDYDFTKITTAWLLVSGSDGNAVYKNQDYSADGTSFYWQNKLNHTFVAIADYNHPSSIEPIYPGDAYFTNYTLTTGSSISDQPDPILATEVKAPTSGDAVTNRVTLNFQHQFSQIQVNLKDAGNSTPITAEDISNVELLGVSQTGYVYTKLNANGTVDAPTASEVNIDNFTDEELATNKWGTSFGMFPTTLAVGYLKSFNAIAFGTLRAIRVTWSGGTATLEVQQTLASGKMYTYNLSIQRPVAGSRSLLSGRSQTSELILDGDVSITNWPVKNR